MWFRGVRVSKYRHIFAKSVKEPGVSYSDLRSFRSDGNVCEVNSIFLAIEADTAFIVIPLINRGRIDFQSCKVIGHAGQILALKFNPFNDHQIASASDDCTIKLWDLPEGGLTSSRAAIQCADLKGHNRKVTMLQWSNSTENVLISSAFDNLVIVWDVSTSSPLNVINCHVEQIYSLAINRDGSLIATTSKDKMLRGN